MSNDPDDLFPPLTPMPTPTEPPSAPPASPPTAPTAAPPPLPPETQLVGDEEWTGGKPQKGVRLQIPVLVALIVIVGLVGLWGGAQLKGDSTTTSTAAASNT